MEKKKGKIIFFMIPAIAFFMLAIFLVSGLTSGLALAVSGNGGGLFVGSSSTTTIDDGIISGNSATNGGGVYVANGGTLNIGKTLQVNDYVYFGSYPKAYQSDTSVITSTQDSNGYYLGTDGNRYAKVSANPYDSSYVFNDGTTIVSGTEYYFKVEPIKWRILKTENGKALLLCEEIITAMWFDDPTSRRNNYALSEVRAYLNGYSTTYGSSYLDNGFLQKAFTTSEQNSILTTEVDNSASTTDSSSNSYACENTNDKVFLLSYQDMINTEYGFNSSSSNYDTAREKQTTDYARANNAYYNTSSDYLYNGYYWLRSSSVSYINHACFVSYNGYSFHNIVFSSEDGVVPALYIDMDYFSDVIISGNTASNNGGGVYVASGGIFNMTGGMISNNTATYGGGVYVVSGGTFNMSGGTISDNIGSSIANNISNDGTFTMTGGTITGTNESMMVVNSGKMNLFGGTITGTIIHTGSEAISTKMAFNLTGIFNMQTSNTATIIVLDYAGVTPEYNITLSSSRPAGTILTLQGSSTAPDLTKLNITGYDASAYIIKAVQGSSSTEWNVVLAEKDIELPSDWKTQVASTTYMTTTVTPSSLTSIKFEKTVPSGYTLIGTLSTGLKVYQSSTDSTAIAFVNDGKIYAPEDSSYLFSSLTSLKLLTFDNFDTSKVIDMSDMFNSCRKVTTLDLYNFDTSKVTNMARIFSFCEEMINLNITSFDTTNVTDMSYMVYCCKKIGSFNLSSYTSKVTNMSMMFGSCSSLTRLDLSGFDTSKVTNMFSMFSSCTSLVTLDLSSFNMTNVTSSSNMFNFGTSGSLKHLKTPYNNTSALEITNGNTLYNVSTGVATSSVPANISSSLTLATKVTVTLDPYYGNFSSSAQTSFTCYYGMKFTDTYSLNDLPTPTKAGYTFKGWYSQSSGGNSSSLYVFETDTATFYAHWSSNSSSGGGGSTGGGGSSGSYSDIEEVYPGMEEIMQPAGQEEDDDDYSGEIIGDEDSEGYYGDESSYDEWSENGNSFFENDLGNQIKDLFQNSGNTHRIEDVQSFSFLSRANYTGYDIGNRMWDDYENGYIEFVEHLGTLWNFELYHVHWLNEEDIRHEMEWNYVLFSESSEIAFNPNVFVDTTFLLEFPNLQVVDFSGLSTHFGSLPFRIPDSVVSVIQPFSDPGLGGSFGYWRNSMSTTPVTEYWYHDVIREEVVPILDSPFYDDRGYSFKDIIELVFFNYGVTDLNIEGFIFFSGACPEMYEDYVVEYEFKITETLSVCQFRRRTQRFGLGQQEGYILGIKGWIGIDFSNFGYTGFIFQYFREPSYWDLRGLLYSMAYENDVDGLNEFWEYMMDNGMIPNIIIRSQWDHQDTGDQMYEYIYGALGSDVTIYNYDGTIDYQGSYFTASKLEVEEKNNTIEINNNIQAVLDDEKRRYFVSKEQDLDDDLNDTDIDND